MPWAVEAVDDYVTNIRPRYRAAAGAALWPTERGGRLQSREIEDRFAEYRDALGLDSDLVPHCLRHSHVTHQIEDGADPAFVQRQVGHRHASTTALYTGVSGDFMNTMMRKVLDKALYQMFSTTDLRPLLAERGIDLSASQVYRLVVERPERLSLTTLMALLDILQRRMEDLIEPTAARAASRRTAAAGGEGTAAGPAAGVGEYRPKRARITPAGE
ncbi:Tyr recombinase domain-containing protein OS=Streptomyces griseomycini OX=66895 GN=FHS37_003530 PE=4 SV=1 [Streptomyces griseomycini]